MIRGQCLQEETTDKRESGSQGNTRDHGTLEGGPGEAITNGNHHQQEVHQAVVNRRQQDTDPLLNGDYIVAWEG